jgi:hypothetical protein
MIGEPMIAAEGAVVGAGPWAIERHHRTKGKLAEVAEESVGGRRGPSMVGRSTDTTMSCIGDYSRRTVPWLEEDLGALGRRLGVAWATAFDGASVQRRQQEQGEEWCIEQRARVTTWK